ncbi:MAG: hypothetical protein Kow0090_19570 [Myxococcota bacterium]
MLDVFRSQKTSLFTWLLFGGIIVFFVINFGPGSFTSGGCGEKLTFAAKVGDRGVTMTDFRFSFHNTLQFYKSRFGDTFDKNMAEKLRLREQVINQLIDEEILEQEARNYGFTVSDEELQKAIVSQPAFQSDGKFDYKLYERLVRFYYQTSPARFEEQQKKTLLASKMKTLITSNVTMSREEIENMYNLQNDRVKFAYVKIMRDLFKNKAHITEQNIAEIKEKYQDKMKAYYEENRRYYIQPEQIRARHILFKFSSDHPSDKEMNELKEKAYNARGRIVGGEDLAKLAFELSDDVATKSNGGDLGFFRRGTMAPEFENVAFSLKVGEVSQPVETRFDFHLIRVEEKKEGVSKTFEEVEEEIARVLAEEKEAERLAMIKANEVLGEVKSGKKLMELYPEEQESKAKNSPVAKESGVITRITIENHTIPNVGRSEELAKNIFTLSKDKPYLDKVFEVDGGAAYVIVEMLERDVPSKKDFEEQYDSLKNRYMPMKGEMTLAEWLKERRNSPDIWVNPAVLQYEESDKIAPSPAPSKRRRR